MASWPDKCGDGSAQLAPWAVNLLGMDGQRWWWNQSLFAHVKYLDARYLHFKLRIRVNRVQRKGQRWARDNATLPLSGRPAKCPNDEGENPKYWPRVYLFSTRVFGKFNFRLIGYILNKQMVFFTKPQPRGFLLSIFRILSSLSLCLSTNF